MCDGHAVCFDMGTRDERSECCVREVASLLGVFFNVKTSTCRILGTRNAS